MTLLDDPPVATTPSVPGPAPRRSGVSSWRLAARLARRETRRRPGRTVLVALLIAVPVIAMTLGSILVRTDAAASEWSHRFAVRYGTADLAIDPGVMGTAWAGNGVELPSGTRSIDYVWASGYLSPTSESPAAYVSFTDAPLTDPMVASAFDVIDGLAPSVGEVLIGPDLAEERGLTVGDELVLDRPAGSWTISGIGRYRENHWQDLVVIPGFDRERIVPEMRQLVQVYDLPAGLSVTEIEAVATGIGALTPTVDPYFDVTQVGPILAWGWVAGVLALVAIGIIVAAAFATSARRQLVTVGQLTSNGATQGVVWRSLALQGTWTALIGTAVGMVAAVAALPFLRGLVVRLQRHDLGSFVVSPRDLVAIAITATVAGTVAAAIPARSSARVPVMSALAGRRPQPASPRWLVPTGLVLVAVGLGLLVVAGTGARTSSGSSFIWPLLVIIGVVGVVFGMVCATPLVVEQIGRLGRSAPLSWRFALRSLARSRTRSAAVVAAIAVTVGGSVAGAAFAENQLVSDGQWDVPPTPSDAVVVLQIDDVGCCEGAVDVGPLAPTEVPADLAGRLDALFPGATYAPLVMATYDPRPIDWSTYDGPFPDRMGPVVATPAMLDLLGLDAQDIETLQAEGALWPRDQYTRTNTVTSTGAGVTLEAGEFGVAGTTYPATGGDIALNPTLSARQPRYGYSLYRPIVTPEYARELGFDLVERGVIIRTGEALTSNQRQALSETFSSDQYSNGVFIEPGDPPRVAPGSDTTQPYWTFGYDNPDWRQGERDLWLVRAVTVGIALLLTALVVAIGLSLAAAEGRDERTVLAVVGARPASLRRQAATRAAVLALVGIGLGIPTGYVPAWVLFRTIESGSINDGFEQPLRVPWLVVGSMVVLIPLAVGAIAWAGSGVSQRFRPPSPTHQD